MSDKKEWCSGDVVVVRYSDSMWRLWASWCESDAPYRISTELFPDPQALAEFVDSQKPKPRFGVEFTNDPVAYVTDRDMDGNKVFLRINQYLADPFDVRRIAEHLAEWLNEQEAE